MTHTDPVALSLETKECNHCHITKLGKEFYKVNNNGRFCLSFICKVCQSEYTRKRRATKEKTFQKLREDMAIALDVLKQYAWIERKGKLPGYAQKALKLIGVPYDGN